MDILMRVHRVSTHPVDVDVTFNGEPARASLPELEVELTNDHSHGSHVLHFRSAAEIASAKDLFKQGDTVTVSYSVGKSAPLSVTTSAEDEHEQAPTA